MTVLFSIIVDDHHTSILFRPGGIGARTGNIGGFDDMENSRRITSNFLFGNTSSSYDFGLMAQTSIDQSINNADISNNNFTFIQATQRTKYELTNLFLLRKNSSSFSFLFCLVEFLAQTLLILFLFFFVYYLVLLAKVEMMEHG
jgi:hypothetical protein